MREVRSIPTTPPLSRHPQAPTPIPPEPPRNPTTPTLRPSRSDGRCRFPSVTRAQAESTMPASPAPTSFAVQSKLCVGWEGTAHEFRRNRRLSRNENMLTYYASSPIRRSHGPRGRVPISNVSSGPRCREYLYRTVVLNDAHPRCPNEHRIVRQNRQLLTSDRQSLIPAYLLIDSVSGKRLEASEVSDAGEQCGERRVAWLT